MPRICTFSLTNIGADTGADSGVGSGTGSGTDSGALDSRVEHGEVRRCLLREAVSLGATCEPEADGGAEAGVERGVKPRAEEEAGRPRRARRILAEAGLRAVVRTALKTKERSVSERLISDASPGSNHSLATGRAGLVAEWRQRTSLKFSSKLSPSSYCTWNLWPLLPISRVVTPT